MAVTFPQIETEIPIIDLEPYLAGDPGALEATAAHLGSALETRGFFLLRHHGVDQALIAQTFAAAVQFHVQPEAVKQALVDAQPLTSQQALARGEADGGYMQHIDAENHNAALYFTKNTPGTVNTWPDLPGFQSTIEAYLTAVEALHMRLLPLLATALRLPAHGLDAALGAPMLLLRLNHYPPVPPGAPQSALAAHADGPLWTMLPASEVPGLEVQGPAGAWELLPVVPGSILVNGGRLLAYWSRQRFPALVHRVVSPVGRARYALPCFIGPRAEALPSFFKGSVEAVLACPAGLPPGEGLRI